MHPLLFHQLWLHKRGPPFSLKLSLGLIIRHSPTLLDLETAALTFSGIPHHQQFNIVYFVTIQYQSVKLFIFPFQVVYNYIYIYIIILYTFLQCLNNFAYVNFDKRGRGDLLGSLLFFNLHQIVIAFFIIIKK